MGVFICRPSVPEETDWDEECKEKTSGKTHLRLVDLNFMSALAYEDEIAS